MTMNTERAFEELNAAKTEFNANHAKRMDELHTAIEEFNNSLVDDYTFYSSMIGNDVVEEYWESVLTDYADYMPEGKFWNLHNDTIDSCGGIALLANGDIVALGNGWCLNPLRIVSDEEIIAKRGTKIALSTYSVGGVFSNMYNDDDYSRSVEGYNNRLNKFCRNTAIVAWIKFNKN